MKYEGHVTFEYDTIQQLAAIESFVEANPPFKFSYITRDPVLGDRPYAYATAYDSDWLKLRDLMLGLKDDADIYGFKVVRIKVEEIIYDKRYPQEGQGAEPGQAESEEVPGVSP